MARVMHFHNGGNDSPLSRFSLSSRYTEFVKTFKERTIESNIHILADIGAAPPRCRLIGVKMYSFILWYLFCQKIWRSQISASGKWRFNINVCTNVQNLQVIIYPAFLWSQSQQRARASLSRSCVGSSMFGVILLVEVLSQGMVLL